MARALMIQGTGSHVGKSVITAALCRIFREDGINVAPFKAQNMALNSFVTRDGKEMGRAQVVQAEAAGIEPHVDMNPILLKPHADKGSQVIIHGKVYGNFSAADYHRFKSNAKKFVEESYGRLASGHDLIVIEGAGSPAEINLRENDLANMAVAHMADAPVLLVGDIDRGGVFASLVGTLELLDEADRERIKGFVINKFRGDVSLLRPGLEFLEKRTGLPVLGVVPCFRDVYIQEEDGVRLSDNSGVKEARKGAVRVAVIGLPHISNFTDFDPFESDEDVDLRYVAKGERIGRADVVIIPGTKSTLADLGYVREEGYEAEIKRHLDKRGTVVGICGGYQMLGRRIIDPDCVEGGGRADGLGLLGIETVMKTRKATHQVEAIATAGGYRLSGYEIHMGDTAYVEGASPLFLITLRSGRPVSVNDGAVSLDGRVWGTYMHGIFENDCFRRDLIERVKTRKGLCDNGMENIRSSNYRVIKEEGYRRLAARVRASLDMEKVYGIAGLWPATG